MKFSIRKLLLILFGLGIVGFLVYAFLPKPVAVDMAAVQRGALLVTIDEDGKTRIKDKYIISAPLGGNLLRIDLDPGDLVVPGKTLATIEPTDPSLLDPRERGKIKAEIELAQRTIEQTQKKASGAKDRYIQAKGQFDTAHQLYIGGSYPTEKYNDARHLTNIAEAEWQAAELAIQVAESQLELARAALIRTEPGGPSAAKEMQVKVDFRIAEEVVVLRVFQESEAVVTPGTKLLEVGNPFNLEVEVDVLSQDGVRIKQELDKKNTVRVFLEEWGGDRPLPGRVRRVEPGGYLKISALGVEEQRVNVIIDFDFPSAEEKRKTLAALGDAYRVVARIVIWEGKDIVKVPAGALFRHEGGWAVFAVADGVATLRPVEVGHTNGLESQILSGLEMAEQVILHPSDQIRDGVQVYGR
jgi:HlyD family secretion protein